MALEDDARDTRHAARNEEALQRAIEQLRPAMETYIARFFEVPVGELGRVRDAVKRVMDDQRRREERKNATVMELLKWGIGAAAGGLVTWFVSHQGGKP